jgi:hypothetical protein
MDKEYSKYIANQPITSDTGGITVKGHVGKWYVINETTHDGRKVFLLEHESYGDDAACIAVDANGNIVCEDKYDDFHDFLEY